MVVLSSVTRAWSAAPRSATLPFLRLPEFAVQHGSQYLLFALLGVLAGAVGVGFIRVL